MSVERWNSANLREMVALCGSQISRRKLNLFTNWCCQVLRPYLRDRRVVAASEFANTHVDDLDQFLIDRDEHLSSAREAVVELTRWAHAAPTAAEMRRRRVYVHAAHVAQQAVSNELPNGGILSSAKFAAYAFGWANDEYSPDSHVHGDQIRESHVRLQAQIFREIVGNPFLPVEFDPHWRTDDVTGLARRMYHTQDFSRMPILSDALMDAGCEDLQILGHCRTFCQHVKGCWLVDLILELE